MKMRGLWPRTILITLTIISFALAAQAATTVVDTELGGTFTGTISVAGDDFIQGRFTAAGGEEIKLTVQAARRTSLVPTVTIRDAGGTPLIGGSSRSIAWMGVGNITHVFTLPAAGVYLAEIGGSSGSGAFTAHLSGSPVASTLVTVSGTITDGLTTSALSGATIFVDGASYATSDASGNFTGQLDPDTYSFVFMADGYTTQTQSVTVSAGTAIADLDVALIPLIAVVLDTSVSGDTTFGGIVTATVDITAPAGTTINSITWTQEKGAAVGMTGADTAIATVTLGSQGDYKNQLILNLQEPLVTAEQLPPNVPLPPGEFHAGLQDRLQVVGINPFSLEEAGVVVLHVEVDTDLGIFTDEVEIHVGVPWKVATGLRDVPNDVPVLLQAKEHTSYDWRLDGPAGSVATLSDAETRHPSFTPDIAGLYELTLAEVVSGSTTLQVYAGTWRGSIVAQDIDGRPVGDTACTFCHDGTFAADMFTDWAQTGHAEIFTDNLDTSTHYGPNCFPCHTIGYDPDADNGGVDEASDYQAFLDAGLVNNPGDNWTTVLAQFPETARMANIQCENCHGPQDSNAHGFAGPLGAPRVDLSSDVCATCHGEPLRHARFQQWQLSAHANSEHAIRYGGSGHCSRCHTANGFLAWLPILLDDDPDTDPTASITVTWESEDRHPQTCVTCHDPHAIGTTTGVGTNATVRISGDTPPLIAGFQVTGVGRGAICMTCHNSRRGLRNDSVWGDLSQSDKEGDPHASAQADVLAGENAYLVEVGARGGHSWVEDTCVTCHMESTPPPAILSYNQGGTNHTFFADRNICAECHSPHLSPDDVQDGIQHLLDMVADLLADAYFDLIEELTADGKTIDLRGDALITDASEISEIRFGEDGGQDLTVTLTDGSVIGPHDVRRISVLETDAPTVSLGVPADDALLKSGWNWALISIDGSLGVHNPFFANSALIASRDALVAIQGGVSAVERDGRSISGRQRDLRKPIRRFREWR